MQPEGAVLPELDLDRREPEARPVRRPGDLADGIFRRRRRRPPSPARSAIPAGATAGSPRRRSGCRAGAWRNRRRPRPAVTSRHRAPHPHLAAEALPVKAERRLRVGEQLAALGAFEIREENEAVGVVPLSRTMRTSGMPSPSTVASAIAFGSFGSDASASPSHAAKSEIGSAVAVKSLLINVSFPCSGPCTAYGSSATCPGARPHISAMAAAANRRRSRAALVSSASRSPSAGAPGMGLPFGEAGANRTAQARARQSRSSPAPRWSIGSTRRTGKPIRRTVAGAPRHAEPRPRLAQPGHRLDRHDRGRRHHRPGRCALPAVCHHDQRHARRPPLSRRRLPQDRRALAAPRHHRRRRAAVVEAAAPSSP